MKTGISFCSRSADPEGGLMRGGFCGNGLSILRGFRKSLTKGKTMTQHENVSEATISNERRGR